MFNQNPVYTDGQGRPFMVDQNGNAYYIDPLLVNGSTPQQQRYQNYNQGFPNPNQNFGAMHGGSMQGVNQNTANSVFSNNPSMRGFSQNGTNTPVTTGNDDRYSTPNNRVIDTPEPMKHQHQEQVPKQQPTKLKHLQGNEFPPLLSDGIRAEVETIGEYFKYIYKGVSNMDKDTKPSNFLVAQTLISGGYCSPLKPFNETGYLGEFKLVAYDGDYNFYTKDFAFMHEMPVPKEISKETYFTLIKESNTMLELANLLSSKIKNATDVLSAEFFLYIDHVLTREINNILQYSIDENLSILSFCEDYLELHSYASGEAIDGEVVDRAIGDSILTNVSTGFLSKLKHSIDVIANGKTGEELDSIISSDIVGERLHMANVPELASICYVREPKIASVLESGPCVKGKTLQVNKISSISTYNLIKELYEKITDIDLKKLMLVTDNSTFVVYSAPNGYYTLTKI